MPAGPDMDLVKKYAVPRNWINPPVFVGRQHVIELVESSWRRVITNNRRNKASPRDTPGYTIVIGGGPGSGKTSLLAHLEERWADEPDSPVFLPLDLKTFADRQKMACSIAAGIEQHQITRIRRERRNFFTAGLD